MFLEEPSCLSRRELGARRTHGGEGPGFLSLSFQILVLRVNTRLSLALCAQKSGNVLGGVCVRKRERKGGKQRGMV